jgi:hypothetical protein
MSASLGTVAEGSARQGATAALCAIWLAACPRSNGVWAPTVGVLHLRDPLARPSAPHRDRPSLLAHVPAGEQGGMCSMHACLVPSQTADSGECGTAGVLPLWLHEAGRCSPSFFSGPDPAYSGTPTTGKRAGLQALPAGLLMGQPCTASLTGCHRPGTTCDHMVHALPWQRRPAQPHRCRIRMVGGTAVAWGGLRPGAAWLPGGAASAGPPSAPSGFAAAGLPSSVSTYSCARDPRLHGFHTNQESVRVGFLWPFMRTQLAQRQGGRHARPARHLLGHQARDDAAGAVDQHARAVAGHAQLQVLQQHHLRARLAARPAATSAPCLALSPTPAPGS